MPEALWLRLVPSDSTGVRMPNTDTQKEKLGQNTATHQPETHNCTHKGAQTAQVLTLLHQLSPQVTKISRTKERRDHKDDWTWWKMFLCVCLRFRSLAHSQHSVLPLTQKNPVIFNKPYLLFYVYASFMVRSTTKLTYLVFGVKNCISRLHKMTFAKMRTQNGVLPACFVYFKDLKSMTITDWLFRP